MPPRPPHPPPHHHRHVPSSAIASFIEPARVEALLTRWVPDPEERAFVVRCMLGEGPAHHRGANYVLLRLLGAVLDRVPSASASGESTPGAAADAETLQVPMRLPPHLAHGRGPLGYPLALPKAPLDRLAGGDARAVEAMADCLTDGPPQHALANVAMVTLLSELLARLEAQEAKDR